MVDKIRKILLICFITALIWVWADLAQTDTLRNQNITIKDTTDNPKLLIKFDSEPRIKVSFSGPVSRIQELLNKIESGDFKLEIPFDAEQQNMSEPGEYDLEVLPFLQQSRKISELGLKVESCDPLRLGVRVLGLVERAVKIECLDENGIVIPEVVIEPSSISMTVRSDMPAEQPATIRLTARELRQVRQNPIEKKPSIEIMPGKIVTAEQSVSVHLPEEQSDLMPATLSGVLGYIVSANWKATHDIVVKNLTDLATIQVRCTSESRQAYEAQTYEILLEIRDEDLQKTGEITREVIYNFPQQYVESGQIDLAQPPAIARFELVPQASASPAAPASTKTPVLTPVTPTVPVQQ